MLVLKIAAGILLALVIAVLLVRGWFRRWMKRQLGDYQVAATLVGDRYAQPARIQLQLAAAQPSDQAFDALWARCHALGFRSLADLEGKDGEPGHLRAAAHHALPLAAAVVITGGGPHYQLFALARDQRLTAIADGPGDTVVHGTLLWQVEPGLPVEVAFERLQRDTEGHELRPMDLRMFRSVYERAHARRADVALARPPGREWIEQAAASMRPAPTPAQIDQACELALSSWQSQVSDAVLDQFREISRIDAARWERIRDDVHVVHAHLRADDVRDMLVNDPPSELLWRQLTAQGLEGIELYQALVQRLPAARRRTCLREVRIPLRAMVYGRDETSSDTAGAAATMHHYEAQGPDGRTVHGALMATDSGDAKRQLEATGMSRPRIVAEAMPLDAIPDILFDEKAAAMAARSARESLPIALLRILQGNLWLWLPPSLLLGWSVWEGAPYGWGDFLAFGYAGLALVAMLVFVAPVALYHQTMQSRMHARWRTARLCLAVLSRLNLLGALDRKQLQLESCKILAGEGNAAEALAVWRAMEAGMPPEQFLTGLVQLHDASGDRTATIAAQRQLLAVQPQPLVRIDLAMALARQADGAEEAENLLAELDPQDLSELALAGYQYARGLVALQRARHPQAIAHFHQAVEQSRQFQNNPLALAMITEINGYVALALKRSGERDQADSIWTRIRPWLGKHASCRELVAEYDATG